MTAHRGARGAEGRFTQVCNNAIRDERLSPLASLIIALVLSYPPDQRFTQDWLRARLLRRPGVTANAIKVALAELEKYGYYIKNRKSLGRGKWEWEQVITDLPEDFTSTDTSVDETTCGNTASSQVSSSTDTSSDVLPADKNSNTDTLNTKHGTARPPKGGARAGAMTRQVRAQTPRRNARGRFA